MFSILSYIRYPRSLHPLRRMISNERSKINHEKEFLSTILAIETSCDDTCASVIRVSDGAVLSNVVSSQLESLTLRHGGVIPNLAALSHKQNLPHVVTKALNDSYANGNHHKPSAVAVTVGPGLPPCLKAGVAYAKEFAKNEKLAVIPVNHLHAHTLSVRIPNGIAQQDFKNHNVSFPFLSLLVTGGHCSISLVTSVDKHIVLGTTVDDAVGEAFDKVGRMLKLDQEVDKNELSNLSQHFGYSSIPRALLSKSSPLGARVEAIAKYSTLENKGKNGLSFPVPLTINPVKHSNHCNFSYSGLKSHIARYIEKLNGSKSGISQEDEDNENETDEKLLSLQTRADIAYAFQEAANIHLVNRVRRALVWCIVGFGMKSAINMDQRIVDIVNMIGESDEKLEKFKINQNSLISLKDSNQKDKEMKFIIKEVEQSYLYLKGIKSTGIGKDIANELEKMDKDKILSTLVVVGGVAQNENLVSKLKLLGDAFNIPVISPALQYCNDNAAMIAWNAIELYNFKGKEEALSMKIDEIDFIQRLDCSSQFPYIK